MFRNIDGQLTTVFNNAKNVGDGFNLASIQVNRFVDGFNRLNSKQNFGSRWTDFINGALSRNANVATYFQNLATQGASARASIEGVYAAIIDGNTKGIGNVKSIISTFNSLDATKQQAFAAAVGQTNVQLGAFLTRNVGATTSLSSYGVQLTAATAKTVALRIATTALNAVLTMGISVGVSLLISAITKFVNKEKEAAQAAEEARKKAVDNAEAFQQEADSLKDLQSRYTEIVASTSDITTVKEELTSIQNELVNKYGDEAKAIDIVNSKYYESIKAIQDLKRAEAEEYVTENQAAYDIAKEQLENAVPSKTVKAVGWGGWGEAQEAWEQLGFDNIKFDGNSMFDGAVFGTYHNYVRITGSLNEQYQTLTAMIDVYKNLDGYDVDRLQLLIDQANAIKEQIDANKTIIDQQDAQLSYLQETSKFSSYPQTLESFQFYKELDKVQELNEKYQNSTTAFGRYGAITQFEDLKEKLNELAKDNTALQEIVDETFSKFSIGADTATTSLSALNDEFAEMLDNDFKSTSDNITKIEDALQSLAEGDYIEHDDFWDIVELDGDDIINTVRQVGKEYDLSANELIKLKDSIIEKQKEQIEADIAEAKSALSGAKIRLAAAKSELAIKESELAIKEKEHALDIAGSVFLQSYKDDIASIKDNISSTEEEITGYERHIGKNILLIRELNSRLGNTVDMTESVKNNIDKIEDEVDELQKHADNLLKAQEDKIDSVVDKLDKQKDVLEGEKEELEKQLDILEKQQEEIENIIEDYETVADIVKDVVQSEIDSIENSRQSIEDYYDEMIDRIQGVNEERQESLDLAEKLAALENAGNNKVKTYKHGAGWVYASSKEEVTTAREELLAAQREAKISKLEKEKEIATSSYDDQVKALEAYANEWESVSKQITDAENAALAEQILGAEWREKIKAQDTAIINTYRSKYVSYKNQLDNLVNGEIASLNKSIEAKEAEIEAVEKQIDIWNDYKAEVQQAVEDIENSLNGYSDLVNSIVLDENSSYEERIANLQNFVNNYSDIIQQISEKNAEIEQTNSALENLQGTVNSLSFDNLSNSLSIQDAWDNILQQTAEKFTEMRNKLSSFFTGGRYANGGVHTKTGFAWMDGTRSASEVTFNAADSKKLYELIHNSSDLSNMVASKIAGNIKANSTNNYQSGGNVSTTNNYNSYNFGDIVANNPEDFMRNMKEYLRNVSGMSKVYKG